LATRAPGGKSPLRGAFGLFLPAYRGRADVTSPISRPLGASMRLAPACRKRLSDLQPDQGVAVRHSFS
ncbi:hypothetical protein KKQ43_22740, partial [Enterobacter cloacae]|nr:hypothetical protein [Enterobacter cloacae]